MLKQLPETGAARERRWGWTVTSVIVHVAIITAAVFAPAGGKEAPQHSVVIDTLIYQIPKPQDGHTSTIASNGGGAVTNTVPTVSQPNFDSPPVPEIPTVAIWTSTGDSAGVADILRGQPDGTGSAPSGSTIGEATVDEPVRVLTESQPRYPSSLRAMGVGGAVVMEFVVDTSGRADLTTARVISSGDERFTAAVRAAIRETRFVAGRYKGHAVRTLVRREFRFELEGAR